MQVKILPFGVLKDFLGASALPLELREGATVADLLSHISSVKTSNLPSATWRSIAVSVNAEYADSTHILRDGDEVGLLPPVSGGSEAAPNVTDHWNIVVALTRDPIVSASCIDHAKGVEDGAIVVFDGIVRNHSRGRRTLYLDYEAYEQMAFKQMNELALEATTRFGVHHVTMIHRLGRLAIGETSVLIVVASAHRAHAYEASRFLIDTLKKTVPIWKKETFVDGVVWADGEPFPEGIAVDHPGAPHAG